MKEPVSSAKPQASAIRISLIAYDENNVIEKQFDGIDECLSFAQPNMIKWINIGGIGDEKVIEKIGDHFSIHPLTLEDIEHTEQRPKFEDYDSYLFAIMRMLYYKKELESEQLAIILTSDTVISFQEVEGVDVFDMVRERIRQGKGRIRKSGADYLAYALVDAVVDSYFDILESLGDHIEDLEEELMANPDKETLAILHHLKREMVYLRKAVWPLRDLIGNMERTENELIKDSTGIYLRDVYDHSIRVIDTVETYRDLLSGMMDIYLSSVSNRMNEVMKVLTVISTIFIPGTFLAGVYGMNFKYMPELDDRWAYPIVWMVIIATMILLIIYFKRKKWL